jgi:multiple sugar transport system permease protein
MSIAGNDKKRLLAGLAFISPNIIGFLGFTLVPLILSMILAFSNWDLTLHNQYKPDSSIEFAGLGDFIELFFEHDFWQFMGNTLFLMIGLPIGIAGSLGAAILLSQELKVASRRVFVMMLIGALMLGGVVTLMALGMGATAITILVVGVAGLMLVGGMLGGQTVYRTLFYLPSFTASVAVFILWKKMCNPEVGPVNGILAGPLDVVETIVKAVPTGVVQSGLMVGVFVMLFLTAWGASLIRRLWVDGEVGTVSALIAAPFLLVPTGLALYWSWGGATFTTSLVLAIGAPLCLAYQAYRARSGQDLQCPRARGVGSAVLLALVLLVLQLIVFGIGHVLFGLPAWAAEGLSPPRWIHDYHWAKPAFLLMGLWAAVGSNTRLLYLAGLSNVPTELYESASIDGASRFQRFWHVTWPQLAPITFFVIIMGVIGGLQGGMEIARAMTRGGPAGATTTLSYSIYTEGFETGRLGYASGVSWVLFALVLVVTLLNWKFGSRYVND